MAENSDSYTFRKYKRNKHILLVIKFILAGAIFWVIFSFTRMLEATRYSLMGILLSSGICLLAYKFIHTMDKQNRRDRANNYNTWGKGAGAELLEEKILETLPHGHYFVKDFFTGRGNIDFIVVGPSGLFTLEIKSTSGLVSYNNNELFINGVTPVKKYLKQAFAQKEWLSHFISKFFGKKYPVVGIIEFPNGKIDKRTIHGKINDVWVGTGRFHEYIIRNSSQKLSVEEVKSIYHILTAYKHSYE